MEFSMKTWKLALSLITVTSLIGCGSDKKVEKDPCEDITKLTKSCLEGKWEMSPVTLAILQSVKPKDSQAGFADDIQIGTKGSYVLTFTVDNEDPTVPDKLLYTRTFNDGVTPDVNELGKYAISADGTALIITETRISDLDIDGTHKASIVAVDSTGNVLKFATPPPVFTDSSNYFSVLEYFYKYKN